MTIVVTGGAGFIGSNFIYYWLHHHTADRVVCVDALTYAGCMSTLKEAMAHPQFRFVQLNICDRAGMDGLFEEEHPDVVVNFAAESHVDRAIAQPDVFVQTNVVGTSVLLDACRQYHVARFHQISTDEVYGALPLEETTAGFAEESPLRAANPYAATKAAADLLVMAYHRTYGLPVTISRCSNNYGPYQFPEKLIPHMIVQALRHEPLPVYGDGKHVRDWLYVEDHCAAVEAILCKGRAGEIYNVGGHAEWANIDLVRRICRELQVPEQQIVYVPDRRGHDRRYAIDPSKLCRELGWQPHTPFEQGIHHTVRWYVAHTDWWQPLVC